MKSLLFVCIIMSLMIPSNWLTDFEQAKREAKKNNRLIILNFSGSDWCAPCIQMKKDVFDKPAFQDYASQNLILVSADFPRHKKNQLDAQQQAHNEKLADLYNPKGQFPLTLLLDANGRVIHEWDGSKGMSAEAFVKQLEAMTNGK